MTHPPIRRRRPSSHAPISRKRAAIVGELMKSEIIWENAALSLPPLPPPPPPCMIPVAGRRSPPPTQSWRGARKYCNKISTILYASVVSLIQHNTARRANRPTDRQTDRRTVAIPRYSQHSDARQKDHAKVAPGFGIFIH